VVAQADAELHQEEQMAIQDQRNSALNQSSMPEQNDGGISLIDSIKENPGAAASMMIPGVAAGAGLREGKTATEGFSVQNIFQDLGNFAHETAYYTPVLGAPLGAGDSFNLIANGSDMLSQVFGVLGLLGIAETGVLAGAVGVAGVGRYGANQYRKIGSRVDDISPHGPFKQGWSEAETHPTYISELLDGMPLVLSSARRNALTDLAGFPDTGAKNRTMFALLDEDSQAIQDIVRYLADDDLGVRNIDEFAGYDHLTMFFVGDDLYPNATLNSFWAGLAESLFERSSLIHDLSTIDPLQAKMVLLTRTVSQWHFLQRRGRLELGGPFAKAQDVWGDLLNKGKFTDADAETLMPAMKAFAEVTQDIGHPEMVILNDPRFHVEKLKLDEVDGIPTAELHLAVNQFESIDPNYLSHFEYNERVRLMFRGNPEAMTHLAAQNITDFFFDEVLPNWESLTTKMGPQGGKGHGKDWYNLALQDIQQMAVKNNVDEDLAVGIASLLSATTSWEVNLDNVASILIWLDQYDGRSTMLARNADGDYQFKTKVKKGETLPDSENLVKEITRNLFGNQQGLYMSGDQAESIRSLIQFVEDGGTVTKWFESQMMKGKNLKVPNFWAAIARSNPDDLHDRQVILYDILAGNITLKDMNRPIFTESKMGLALSEAFKTFPMTVDRHAYAIALGYSTKPHTDATMLAAYDPIKLAYLASAELIGDVRMDKRLAGGGIDPSGKEFILDPNELQALTWLRWRELRDVTRRGVETTPPPGLFAEGVGPIEVFSDRILKFVRGQLPDGVDLGGPKIAPMGQKASFDDFGKTKGTGTRTKQGDLKATQTGYNSVILEITPNGARWVAKDGSGPNQFTFPSQATNAEGLAIHMPRQALVVDDVNAQLQRTADTTYIVEEGVRTPASVGARFKPEGSYVAGLDLASQGATGLHTKGNHIVISIPNIVSQTTNTNIMATVAGLQHHIAIRNHMGSIKGHLNNVVDYEFLVNKPHTGKATVWRHPEITNYDGSPMNFYSQRAVEEHIMTNKSAEGLDPLKAERMPDLVEEPRIELIISFATGEDLRKAHAILTAPQAGAKSSAFTGINTPYISQMTAGYTAHGGRRTVSGRALELDPPRLLRSQRTAWHEKTEIELDPVIYDEIAQWYDNYDNPMNNPLSITSRAELELAARHGDPAVSGAYRPVLKAWQAFEDEIKTQFAYLQELGIKVEVVDADPYASPLEMITDLTENNTIKILSSKSTGGHPFLPDHVNDMWRAIHDVFGHASEGANFTRHGEFYAAAKHMMMFSKEARPAMLFDTLGQNASLIKNGKHPPQTIGLMPEKYWPDSEIWGDNSPYAKTPTNQRVIDLGHQEQVLDYRVVTDPAEMPADVLKVNEHYFVDGSGTIMVHNSKQGTPTNMNTRTVGILRGENSMETYMDGETGLYTAGDPTDKGRAVGDAGSTQFQRGASRGEQGVETMVIGNTRYSGGKYQEHNGKRVPVRMVPIEELADIPDWSWNESRRSIEEMENLKASIAANGFAAPVQVMINPRREQGFFGPGDVIVASMAQGNHRLTAARELGLTHVPVIGRWDIDFDMGVGDKPGSTAQGTAQLTNVDPNKAKQARASWEMDRVQNDHYFDINELLTAENPELKKTAVDKKLIADEPDDFGLEPSDPAWIQYNNLEEGPMGLTWGGKISIRGDVRVSQKTSTMGSLQEPGHIFGVEVATDVYKSGPNKGQPKYEKPTNIVMYVPEDPRAMPVIAYNSESISGLPLDRQVVLQTAKKDGTLQKATANIPLLVVKPLSTLNQDGRTAAAKTADIELVTKVSETLKNSGLVFGALKVMKA